MSAGPTTAPVTVRPLADDDLPAVLDLLSASLAGGPTGERTEAFFTWKHRDNPAGASLGLVAVDPAEGAVVGVRLFLRWDLRVGDERVRAVRAVDTATHPDHQGRGIFRRLTTAALDEIDVEGVHLVFNTPNDQSRPGYLKMGWQPVGEVPVRLRPVRPVRFARGILRRQRPAGGARGPRPRQLAAPDRRGGAGRADRRGGRPAGGERGRRRPRPAAHRPDAGVAALALRRRPRARLPRRAGRAPRRGSSGSAWAGCGAAATWPSSPSAPCSPPPATPAPPGRCCARRPAPGRTTSPRTWTRRPGWPGRGCAAGYLPVPGRGLTLVTNARRPLPVDPTALASWSLDLGDLEVF